MNFSNNSNGFLLNGVYGLYLPPWPSYLFISPYLCDLLQHHEPRRSLRSSSSHQPSVHRHNLIFGSRAFRFSTPRVWNSLPVSIRKSQSLFTFKRHLNTFYFQSAYTPFQMPTLPRIGTRPDSSKTLALYKSCTYLLTYLLTFRRPQCNNIHRKRERRFELRWGGSIVLWERAEQSIRVLFLDRVVCVESDFARNILIENRIPYSKSVGMFRADQE